MFFIFILILLCLIFIGYNSKEPAKELQYLVWYVIAYRPNSLQNIPAVKLFGKGFALIARFGFNISLSSAYNVSTKPIE